MMQKKIKVGIVGAGHIVQHRHIPAFKKIDEAEVSVICDKEAETAKHVAETFRIKKSYSDFHDLLKADVDVIDICTPPQTHRSLAIGAMEAGYHVLVEKPLGMTVKEVDEMYAVSRRENVKLCVVHQNIHNSVVKKAQALVNSGQVGEVISVESGTYVRRDNYMCLAKNHWCHRLPGGIFFEILPHPIYLLQFFVPNLEVECVKVKKITDYSWMKADEARVLLEGNHTIGSIVASHNSPFHGDSINIFGTEMSLQVDLWGRSIIKYESRTEKPFSVGKANLKLAGNFFRLLGSTLSATLIMVFKGIEVSAHHGFLSAFIQSLRMDKDLPVSQYEARENVRLVHNICDRIDQQTIGKES
jgi:predicted dehydrogenase